MNQSPIIVSETNGDTGDGTLTSMLENLKVTAAEFDGAVSGRLKSSCHETIVWRIYLLFELVFDVEYWP